MKKLNFFEKYCKISKILIFVQILIFFQILKNLKSLKNLTIFFKILNGLPGWFNRPAWLADPVFWGPGLCCSWPAFPDRLHWALTLKPSDTYTSGPKNRSQPLHQPLRISKGWRERYGSGWLGNHYGGEWSSRGVWDTFLGPLKLQGQLVMVDLEHWFK